MIFDGRYKLVHAEGHRPMIYDLLTDPDEFYDRGEDPQLADEIKRMIDQLHAWYRKHHCRTTMSDEHVGALGAGDLTDGVYIGFWDAQEL